MKIISAKKDHFPEIKKLLDDHELPVSDLNVEEVKLLVAVKEGTITGCIGLELYGNDGLLRSLAVKPGCKNQGIAGQLLSNLYQYARSKGIKTLHLLTTTADQYFLKKGFEIGERESAPEQIKKTTEFSSICPSTAVCREPVMR